MSQPISFMQYTSLCEMTGAKKLSPRQIATILKAIEKHLNDKVQP